MYQKSASIYYALGMVVIGATAFTLQPTQNPELTVWQDGAKDQFATALVQVIGDQPWFTELGLVFDGVESFYSESSTAVILMFSSPESDADIYYVFSEAYNRIAATVKLENTQTGLAINYDDVQLPPLPVNFMQKEPLYNLVPYKTVVKTVNDPEVAGESISVDKPANSISLPWVTVRDNLTGQLYCLAVYNGAVNQYLGPCKYDYE